MISSVELSDEQKLKFNQAIHGFYPLTDVVGEVAAEFKLENKLNLVSLSNFFILPFAFIKNSLIMKFCFILQEINALMKYQDLQSTLRSLSDLLFMPETFEHAGNVNDCF